MNQAKIGRFIAELRKEQGWTQMQLGERLGVSNKTISRWENGNYMPDLAVLPELAELLAVSVNELIAGQRFVEADYKRGADEQLLQTMQLLAEVRSINNSRWLSNGMEFMGMIIVLALLSRLFLGINMDMAYMPMSNSPLRWFLLVGLVICIGSILLLKDNKLHRGLSNGAGVMLLGLCWYGSADMVLMLLVFSLLFLAVGLLADKTYHKAIDRLLDNTKDVKI